MFESRKITPAAFIKEFFETLTPGVIPRSHFIDWNLISAKQIHNTDSLEYFKSVAHLHADALGPEIRDTLLAADNPTAILKCAFELLGHTNQYYVSDVDNLNFRDVAKSLKEGSEHAAQLVADIVTEIGIERILKQKDLDSAFFGVQVGLESNRRKSVGGKEFSRWCQRLLESTCALLGSEYELKCEEEIEYVDAMHDKTLDFVISHKGKTRIAVEVNFYTTSGSKPSEIKRAYETVNRELNQLGIELVWITDGAGYLKMKKALEEAFQKHANTYNYEMATKYLKEDIYEFLK
ncbi:MAG: DpnII family type II restriction endonuclease [Candidatus Acidiferrales bacterium]